MMLHYDAVMRTTVDLPSDLHAAAKSLARDRGQSLSQTIADLIRSSLRIGPEAGTISRDPRTDLPLVRLGHVVTSDDVRALEDE